jgi:hypothetical protein
VALWHWPPALPWTRVKRSAHAVEVLEGQLV